MTRMTRWLIVTALFTAMVLLVLFGLYGVLHALNPHRSAIDNTSSFLIENRTHGGLEIVRLFVNGEGRDLHRHLEPSEFTMLLGVVTTGDEQTIELLLMVDATGAMQTYRHHAKTESLFRACDFKFVIGPTGVEASRTCLFQVWLA